MSPGLQFQVLRGIVLQNQLPQVKRNQRGFQRGRVLPLDHRVAPVDLGDVSRTTVRLVERGFIWSGRLDIRLTSPEIDWSYAVIERQDAATLKTTLVPFDLGKLVLQHDTSQDLELQPGDMVSIFSQSDIHVPLTEQTGLVRLEGEFAHAGTYSVRPGETLRSLVARAGGLTPDAYLFGSVFTRESTRVLQQRRMDEAVQRMVLQMQRGTLAMAASGTSSPQDVSSASGVQASSRELTAQLQKIGRQAASSLVSNQTR